MGCVQPRTYGIEGGQYQETQWSGEYKSKFDSYIQRRNAVIGFIRIEYETKYNVTVPSSLIKLIMDYFMHKEHFEIFDKSCSLVMFCIFLTITVNSFANC